MKETEVGETLILDHLRAPLGPGTQCPPLPATTAPDKSLWGRGGQWVIQRSGFLSLGSFHTTARISPPWMTLWAVSVNLADVWGPNGPKDPRVGNSCSPCLPVTSGSLSITC